MSLCKFLDLRILGPLAQFLVSGTVAFTFIGCLIALFVLVFQGIDVPAGTREILCLVIGALVGEFKGMCSHWIGSSLGSDLKTQTILDPERPSNGAGQ